MNFQSFTQKATDSLLVLWDSKQGRLPLPTGRRQFGSPSIAAQADGKLHLLWSENESLPEGAAVHRLLRPGKSLWWSRFDGSWSVPTQVHRGSFVLWSGAAAFALGGGRTVDAVVVSADSSTGKTYPLLLTFDGVTYRSVRIPGIDGLAEASVARDDSGEIFVVYTASAPEFAGDQNSVFFARTTNSGERWASPILVSRSGKNLAFEVRVLRGPSGLHLLWQQTFADSANAVLRHVASLDGGTTWTVPEDLNAGSHVGSVRAVVDECDVIHVVFENQPPLTHLSYAQYKNGWSAQPVRVFPQLNTMDPILIRNGAGHPLLIFNVVVGGANGTPRVVTMFSQRRGR